MGQSNVKENQTRAGIINSDVLNWQPQEKLFLREALNPSEPSKGEISPNHALIKSQGIKLGQTRAFKEDLKEPSFRKGVILDILGKKPPRQAPGLEEVMDGQGLGRRER